ncbi:MAG: winged helix-turn-helix domain-containing protein [Candidatus Korarchaeota archaeon]|nr:winged helix-turn-helix domain-containing protein [Candidatus Korarchaeota archaeon]
MRRKYRSQAAIVMDVLEAISAKPGIAPTRLSQEVNVPYSRLTEYLRLLMEKGLVYEEEKGELHLSEKGFKYLIEMRRFRKIFSSLGLML